jgi:hypothetical protein
MLRQTCGTSAIAERMRRRPRAKTRGFFHLHRVCQPLQNAKLWKKRKHQPLPSTSRASAANTCLPQPRANSPPEKRGTHLAIGSISPPLRRAVSSRLNAHLATPSVPLTPHLRAPSSYAGPNAPAGPRSCGCPPIAPYGETCRVTPVRSPLAPKLPFSKDAE